MAYDLEAGAGDCSLLIDNKWRPAADDSWAPVLNPVDESVVGRHAVATVADLDAALAAAAKGFQTWRATPPAARSKVLRAAAALQRSLGPQAAPRPPILRR